MRLDAGDFEAVWQHLCARALVDHAQGTLMASFVWKGEPSSPDATHDIARQRSRNGMIHPM